MSFSLLSFSLIIHRTLNHSKNPRSFILVYLFLPFFFFLFSYPSSSLPLPSPAPPLRATRMSGGAEAKRAPSSTTPGASSAPAFGPRMYSARWRASSPPTPPSSSPATTSPACPAACGGWAARVEGSMHRSCRACASVLAR